MRAALIRLYPARWRARYGDEFAAILEERSLGPYDVADIILGALDARLRSRRVGAPTTNERGVDMSLRVGGYTAVLAGILVPVGLLAASDVIPIDPTIGIAMFMLGMLALLVALAGLSAFQARTHSMLIWIAFALPASGVTVTILGAIGMIIFEDEAIIAGISSWYIWMFGLLTVFAGSLLFALVTYRTGALSRWAALVLAFGSLAPLVGLVTGASGLFAILDGPLIIAGVVGYTIGWVGLGVAALRMLQPASVAARPA